MRSLLFKIIQFSCIVHPKTSGGHMIHKTQRIGLNNHKLRRKGAALSFTDPEKLIGNLLPDTFFGDIAGIVPKTAPVKIAEDNLLFFHRQQKTQLPGPPDQSAMQGGIDLCQYGIQRRLPQPSLHHRYSLFLPCFSCIKLPAAVNTIRLPSTITAFVSPSWHPKSLAAVCKNI